VRLHVNNEIYLKWIMLLEIDHVNPGIDINEVFTKALKKKENRWR